jgi:hypothetical protein
MQNKSSAANSSTNFAVSNNLGTDSTYYGEFGMNSSGFSSGTPNDFFSINNGIYFSGHDGDMSIGSGNGFKTYITWGTAGDKAHVVNASGAIGLNTNITGTSNFGTTGQVLTSAGSAATPTWTTTGTVTSVATGTGLTGGPISSTGTISIDSTVTTLTGTQTLSNKRIDPRVTSAATATTLTPSIATADVYAYTALASALTINAPTGTPLDGNKLIFRLLDNGTARALTWDATYTVIGTTLPTTTVISKTTYVGCIYNANNTRWDVIAVTTQA